ncbi:MAG TPA: NifB/NifX family molybdenum-iron cluster-binding protein [Thermoanaerobaculia bacterium]
MKVAIPSDDRASISAHFGRARGFLIYDIDNGAVAPAGYRDATHEHDHDCHCETGQRASRHEAVLDALAGCEIVIARGMGAHMYDDLLASDIDVFLTDTADATTAVEQLLSHALPERASLGCFE